MKSGNESKIPFDGSKYASKQEIQNYLSRFVEEYMNITKVDLPKIYERFPLWAYPLRVVAGITSCRVYIFATRDGNPKKTRVEVYDFEEIHELGQVMDFFQDHQKEVATILNVQSAISSLVKEARQDQFSDDTAHSDALSIVKRDYMLIEKQGEVKPERFSKAKLAQYVPPIDFLENHIESSELKNRVEQMIKDSQKEVMISGWIDTSLLEILREKSQKGVAIRIITNKPDEKSPQPVKTAYRRLVDIAQVRRHQLRHFRMIICDNEEVLISSADLTTHSLSQNYEAGIWTTSPSVVERAITLFEKVWKHKETKDVNQELASRR